MRSQQVEEILDILDEHWDTLVEEVTLEERQSALQFYAAKRIFIVRNTAVTTIRFRPVLLGNVADPVKVCYIIEGQTGMFFVDDNISLPIEGVSRLEEITLSDLPAERLRTLPSTEPRLLPVHCVQAETERQARKEMYNSLYGYYKQPVAMAKG